MIFESLKMENIFFLNVLSESLGLGTVVKKHDRFVSNTLSSRDAGDDSDRLLVHRLQNNWFPCSILNGSLGTNASLF